MNIYQASPILLLPPDQWAAAFGQTPVGNDSPLTLPPSGPEMHERLERILKGEGYSLDEFSRHVFAAKNPALFSDPSLPIGDMVSQRASLLEQGHPVQHDDFVVEPLDQLAIQHLIRKWGWKDIPTDGLAGFLSQIAIAPNEDLRNLEDHTFETEIRLATFEGPVNIEPLHHLARLFQTPLTLARHLLADYRNKIPSELWEVTARQIFGKENMGEVSRLADILIPDTQAACYFFNLLLDFICSRHYRRERWQTAWRHFRGQGPSWKEKKARLAALSVKILAAFTLEFKYNREGQEKFLGLKKRLKKMEPSEMADAVEMVRNFFRHELMETLERFPDSLFPRTRKELKRGKTGPSLATILAFIPTQVLQQFQRVNQLAETATHWRRTARVDFRPRREILDAFFGVAGNNCTGKAEFVAHALSDPAFQPVRILVDGEFAGSFMTYSTVFDSTKIGPMMTLGPHIVGGHEIRVSQRVLIVSGIDSRARFEPESFAHNLLKYLRKIAENGEYDLVLLPKYEGSQSSHDVALRKALQERAAGSFTTKKDVYYPKRGPGNDPERDYHPHSTSKDGYWVLFQGRI